MLAETVREAARRFGRSTVLEAPGTTLTYVDLHHRSDALAAGLYDAGVRSGQRVALRLPSGPSYLLAYAAAAKLGAAVAGVNSALTPVEQSRLVELVDPCLVLEGDDAVAALEERGARLPPPAAEPTAADRDVALVFTSGTTGHPRAAVFRAAQLEAVARLDTGGGWADAPGTPMLASTHFAHVGFMTKLPWYLRRGLHLHVLERWRAHDVLHIVATRRLAEIGAVAPQVALLLREPDFDELDLSCVRRLVVGGAASSPALVAEARRRFGADYVVRYSSTESGGCGLGTAPDSPEEAMHSIGRPRPGIQAVVRDRDGRRRAPGEVGELSLRSPTTMVGYWRDPDATREALDGGWLRTGDLATVRPDGTFELKGRLKEMYICGGYNIYPAEVEAALAEHPAVRTCAVQPRPDATMGEVGVAVVTLRHAQLSLTLDELRDFLRARVASWKLPAALLVVDELPLNGTHKVDRRVLSALVARAVR